MKHSKGFKVGVVAGLTFFLTACPGPTPSPSGDFSLRLEPSDPKLAAGGSTTASLRITRNNGFAGAIQLSLENAPAGVTATFDPNPATSDTSTVTLEAPKTLAAGNYTVQIKGVSGAATNTTSVGVTVGTVTPSTVTVDASLTPITPSVPALPDGIPRPVVALTDTKGHQVNYIQNELVIFSNDPSAVNAFITRWNGTILNRADPPNKKSIPGLKSVYTVRVNASSANTNTLINHLSSITPSARSDLRVSSDNALKLLAVAAQEKVAGLDVTLNYLWESDTFDDLSSTEGPTSSGTIGGSYSPNAFDWPYMKQGGNQDINVVDAWRALERAGKINANGATTSAIDLGIIDGGFSDNSGLNTDFPVHTVESDEWNQPNPSPCGGGGSCPWHGTNVALAAAARLDNSFGTAGPAGPVARVMLEEKAFISLGGTSVFELIDQGAEIINMSYGARFPAIGAWIGAAFDFFTAVADANDVLLFASAGNDGETVDGEDCFIFCWEEAYYSPCENSFVICVGGLADDSRDRHPNSNFGGENVDIYGPFCVYVGADPQSSSSANQRKCGTSFSSPFVAGVAALIWAANPSLDDDAVRVILMTRAHQVTSFANGQTALLRKYVNAFGAVRFALGNIPPRIVIDAPADNSSFLYATDKTYKATVDDLDSFTKPSVTWTSSLDGTLGTGSEITTHFTSPGTRTITATATDEDGAKRTASIIVTGTNSNPSAQIILPNNNATFYVNDPVPFDGEGLDGDGAFAGPMPCGSLSWKSSKAGDPDPLFTGCAKNNVVFTTTGTRTITLTATDAHGGKGTDTVTVNIVVKPPTGPPTVNITAPKEGASFVSSSKIKLSYTLSDPGGTPQSQYTTVWKLKIGSTEKVITPKLCTGQVSGVPFAYSCFVPADYGINDNGVKISQLSLTVTDPENLTGTDKVTINIGVVP